MTIITKGMGAVLKSIKGLKKSKTFPGPNVEKQLIKKIKSGKIKKHGKGWDISERIGRTQRARDIMATKIKGFRKDKGKFTAYTGNTNLKNVDQKHLKYGNVRQEGPVAVVTKAGTPKKDLRKFKEFIKTGTRRK